jgi:hypothetical protein
MRTLHLSVTFTKHTPVADGLYAINTKIPKSTDLTCIYFLFHTVDTVHLRHIKLGYRPTDALKPLFK